VDRFLPRIVFGKTVADPGKKNLINEYTDVKGFSYLKRDLVCLVGTICYERKDMQDMVRKCGGIEVVMNLCVIDERNPCMLILLLDYLPSLLVLYRSSGTCPFRTSKYIVQESRKSSCC
jgi:ataxin-10